MKKNFIKRKSVVLFCLSFAAIILSAQTKLPKEENSVRIMSYNINRATGMDGDRNIERIAEVINNAQPDFVALQDIDFLIDNDIFYNLDELAKNTLMYPVEGEAFISDDYNDDTSRSFGLLAKEKPAERWNVIYPDGKDGFLLAEFKDFYVCCAYFPENDNERAKSVNNLTEKLKEFSIEKPLFLAGDMSSTFDSETHKKLQENFKILNNYKQNTYPADNPESCTDFIYGYNYGGVYPVLSRRVINETTASDHRPVVVDVRFKADVNDIFRTKPYLQNPTGNGMTISWLTNVPVHSWIEYGENGKLDKRKELYVDGQMICNNKHHKIRLTGLTPGKTYSYRVCSREMLIYQAYYKEFGETAYSDVYSFTMPSDKTTDFTAVIFNDIHKNNKIVDLFSEQLKNINYDLVFFNGDCIDDPKNEAEAVGSISYMNEKVHAEKVPVMYLRGNHEIRNAYSIEMRDLFDYVNDKTYGAFNWGDTRIVMLDCGEDKPDNTWVYYGLNDFEGLRHDQIGFLQQELKSNDFKKATKRVLIHHIPIYGNDDKYNPCLELWGGILAKAPFNVSLNAHTHRYSYHPKGEQGNNFPVVIGGGNREKSATMMLLEKKGNKMQLRVLDTEGNEKLKLDL